MRAIEIAGITALIMPWYVFAVDTDRHAPATEVMKEVGPGWAGLRSICPVASIRAAEDVTGNKVPVSPVSSATGGQSAHPLRLIRPLGLAVDNGGRIFVADPGHRGVLIYDRQGHAATRWTGNAAHPLYGPAALAFDAAGRLFVSDAYQSQVLVFDTGGNVVAAFGKGMLERPSGVAVDLGRNRVYVADTRKNLIVPFDLRTFEAGPPIGGPAAKDRQESGRFSGVASLAVSSNGELYVSDMWNCRVQVFRPDGTFKRELATRCAAEREFGRPHLVASDREDRIYVAVPETGEIQVFGAEGRPLSSIAAAGPSAATPALRTGIAVDRNYQFYLAEQRHDEPQIRVFSRNCEDRARANGSPSRTRKH